LPDLAYYPGLERKSNNIYIANRTEISAEVRLNRDDFRSHLDERISIIEHELAQIKAKIT